MLSGPHAQHTMRLCSTMNTRFAFKSQMQRAHARLQLSSQTLAHGLLHAAQVLSAIWQLHLQSWLHRASAIQHALVTTRMQGAAAEFGVAPVDTPRKD